MTPDQPKSYEVRADESTSEAVIRAVSTVRGVDPVDMDACLYDAIDPAVLDAVFETAETDTPDENRRLIFTFDGCEVEVRSDGVVSVMPIAARADSGVPSAASPNFLRSSVSPWQLVFQQP